MSQEYDIPFIQDKDWDQYEEAFFKKSKYVRLYEKHFSLFKYAPNAVLLQRVRELKKKTWSNTLEEIKTIFEVEDIKKIEDSHQKYVERFIFDHYLPTDELRIELEELANTILNARLEGYEDYQNKHSSELNSFKEVVKNRLRLSLERQKLKEEAHDINKKDTKLIHLDWRSNRELK